MWYKLTEKEMKSLSLIKDYFPMEEFEVFAFLPFSYDHKGLRRAFDGLWTIKIQTKSGKSYAIVYNDFKIFGGSFGIENSQRFVALLKDLRQNEIPLFASFNSIGVRIMEGRKVFPHAFSIIPPLVEYCKENIFVASVHGKCLGIGALLYTLADYKLALKETSQINLTGPEVFRMFFGETVNFDENFNSERMRDTAKVIHEVCPTSEEIANKVKTIFGIRSISACESSDITDNFLDQFFDKKLPLLSQKKSSVKTYLAERNGVRVGILINPLEKGNMIDLKTIDSYKESLNIFNSLKLPIMSFVDTPGADPGIKATDGGLIQNLAALTGDIISYPHKKIGVLMNRCYGGASVLSMPPIYGGEKALAMKGAHLGIMGKQIIRELLSNSPRLLEMWEENSASENNLDDLIEMGMIDGEYSLENMKLKVDEFLFDYKVSNTMTTKEGIKNYERIS